MLGVIVGLSLFNVYFAQNNNHWCHNTSVVDDVCVCKSTYSHVRVLRNCEYH